MAEAALDAAPARRLGLRHLVGAALVAALAFAVGYWFVVVRGRETTDDAFVEGHLGQAGRQIRDVLKVDQIRLGVPQYFAKDPFHFRVLIQFPGLLRERRRIVDRVDRRAIDRARGDFVATGPITP